MADGIALSGLAMLVGVACGVRQGEIEPRWLAVHNTLAAMGMAQVGPVHRGSLAEGRDVRVPVDLPAECTTVVAIGGPGVSDLDVGVLDADDKLVVADATKDAQAAVRVCPEKAGRFTLLVRMTRGAGEYVAGTWTGGPVRSEPGLPAASLRAAIAAGTCDDPVILTVGSTAGNTRRGVAEHSASCGSAESKEIVHRLDLEKRQRVTIDVDPTFDSVLYVRKDACDEPGAEVACSDDVASAGRKTSASRGSRIDEVFDPGTYWVFVDGYQSEVGSYRMNVQISEAPTLEDACRQARPLLQKASGTITGGFDHASGSCDQSKGPDAVHRLEVPQRARVRVVLRSEEFEPILHVRSTCLDDRSEVGCTSSGMRAEEAVFVGILDKGVYAVFADSQEKTARGQYTLEADLATEQGAGIGGDACGDAMPIVPNGRTIEGDTFQAHDDIAGSCTGSGAPDAVYRFEVSSRSRVTAKFVAEEGDHVFVLRKDCTDKTTEIACGSIIDQDLAPGVYWLAVDGSMTMGPFGRYAFQLKVRDLLLQESACRAPPPLVLGRNVVGTTAGAGDHFATSCAGREDGQASSDRVYKLTIAKRTRVQLLLSTPSHDGVLAIRKSCIDPPNMRTLRSAEVACNNDSSDNRHSKLEVTLDPGTYFVVVDGHLAKNEGPFTLEAREVK
jgi:hypothetical protein